MATVAVAVGGAVEVVVGGAVVGDVSTFAVDFAALVVDVDPIAE